MTIYHDIRNINITEIVYKLEEENRSSEDHWVLDFHEGLHTIVEERLKSLDFHSHGYITGSKVYWSGILTMEPFDDLYDRYDCEEAILNDIKDHNLKVWTTPDGLLVSFYNPYTSPLYSFFSEYKNGGYGGNIPYSIKGLMDNLEKYLREDIIQNPEVYGTWNLALPI